jgi:hypothetical protein
VRRLASAWAQTFGVGENRAATFDKALAKGDLADKNSKKESKKASKKEG